ncbi:MAG: hypothetical protein NTV69_12720 [Caldilinea sp.]|nr:hypothetical protein [Caldilinea sp.]
MPLYEVDPIEQRYCLLERDLSYNKPADLALIEPPNTATEQGRRTVRREFSPEKTASIRPGYPATRLPAANAGRSATPILEEAMCKVIFLLADHPIPLPLDEGAYPGLQLYPVEANNQPQTFAGIQRVSPAAFVYDVVPAGYCGCYFEYETPEEFQAQMAERAVNPGQYVDSAAHAETMWQSQKDAVRSFGRYLAAHPEDRLSVYSVWENCAGQKAPVRAEVPPSYFGGTGFDLLPEDVLLTLVPEPTGSENLGWDPAAHRTHEWLGCGRTDVW